MTILIINNHGQYNHRISRSLRYLNIPSQLVSNELSVEEILSMEPTGLILGGGPDIKRAGNSLNYIKEIDVPILGICLGHQLLAMAFGGEVQCAEHESYASVKIDILDDDSFFKGIGDAMDVWSSHKDEVKVLPDVFRVLASSELCDVEAIVHKDKPVYGIQFHPEVHHTPKGNQIFENFYNICKNY